MSVGVCYKITLGRAMGKFEILNPLHLFSDRGVRQGMYVDYKECLSQLASYLSRLKAMKKIL